MLGPSERVNGKVVRLTRGSQKAWPLIPGQRAAVRVSLLVFLSMSDAHSTKDQVNSKIIASMFRFLMRIGNVWFPQLQIGQLQYKDSSL